ncbi:serine/threonine-protein kinase [Actinopolyspora saharensis]|uniref:serine/threonine-protein kinase n=1 Tax=Actinopolyspora saharensis TaxID=995062 RepID=UPI003F66BD05
MVETPRRIGRYTVLQELGSGGMGEVVLAYSPAGDPVAIKLIRGDRIDPRARARFEREAQIAQTVIGTNRVARFLEAAPRAEQPWLVMEYVPGQTLLAHVDERGTFPVPLVASLGALLAEGLSAVHDADLLHRDLKPQNIILSDDGPKLIDFGLAAFANAEPGSLSQSGQVIGSVRCMPPEQANGNPQVTKAADVYSLGTVLLYAAAGHYPYDGTKWMEILTRVADSDHLPDLSGLPEALLPLVSSMLAYEATQRPSLDSVAESCADLLERQQLTPAEARHALIRRTSDRASADPCAVLSSTVEELIHRSENADAEEQVNPLDTPSNSPEVEPSASVESRAVSSDEGQEEMAHSPADSTASTNTRTAPPVSQQVAEELREAYALRAAL